ncbi:cytochrome P450 [Trichoderma sp. SZMC 28015]
MEEAFYPVLENWPLLFLLGIAGVYILQRVQYRQTYKDYLNLPWVGDGSTTDLRFAMEQGTRKYPDRPFILPLQDPTVILPHSVIEEVKSLPASQASIERNNYRRFFGQYTLMGIPSDEFVSSIKQDLTRHVGILLPELFEEARFATDCAMGGDKTCHLLPVYPAMLRYIALLSGRTFVGLPLSRSEDWIQSSIQYAVESVEAGHQLRAYPTTLRRLVAPFLAKIRRVQQHQKKVRHMLRNILAKSQELEKSTDSRDPDQGRLALWLRRHYRQRHSTITESDLGKDHLLASFAAIHIATNALTQILLDLAARPEYQEPLRNEAAQVLDLTGESKITMAELSKLVRLDSFMKESLRASPPGGVVTMMRELTAPIALSCGPILPKGTLIAFANNRFDMSSHQPSDPDDFDGFRFVKEDGGSRQQLITTSHDSLTWGYGSHACPGRQFAATELKVIIIHLLTNFDLRMKDGAPRPANSSHDFQIMPDPHAVIEFCKRNN